MTAEMFDVISPVDETVLTTVRFADRAEMLACLARDWLGGLLWARWWWQGASIVFLKSYLTTAGQAAFLPRTRDDRQVLLDIYLLEKAFYELGYELHNRPEWVRIPLHGSRQLVGAGRE